MGDHKSGEPNGDLPIWVRVLWRYGIQGFLLLVFAYVILTAFTGDLKIIRDEQRIHINETQFYLRAICLNLARDEGQRALCVPRGK